VESEKKRQECGISFFVAKVKRGEQLLTFESLSFGRYFVFARAWSEKENIGSAPPPSARTTAQQTTKRSLLKPL
jgi:hypothetical protein